jgi:hypothetical protein
MLRQLRQLQPCHGTRPVPQPASGVAKKIGDRRSRPRKVPTNRQRASTMAAALNVGKNTWQGDVACHNSTSLVRRNYLQRGYRMPSRQRNRSPLLQGQGSLRPSFIWRSRELRSRIRDTPFVAHCKRRVWTVPSLRLWPNVTCSTSRAPWHLPPLTPATCRIARFVFLGTAWPHGKRQRLEHPARSRPCRSTAASS